MKTPCSRCRVVYDLPFTRNKGGREFVCARCQNRKNKYRPLKRFNLTPERFGEILQEQGGLCAICFITEEESIERYGHSFHVDHDHDCCPGSYSCGECVRGILCLLCNMMLGSSRDDPEVLRQAIRYLRQYGIQN